MKTQDLDDKLREIKVKSPLIKPLVYLTDEAIAQIKQAFADDNWIKTSMNVVETFEELDKLKRITPQEFYSRFENELDSKCLIVEGAYTYNDIIEAAKRAAFGIDSGLENDSGKE